MKKGNSNETKMMYVAKNDSSEQKHSQNDGKGSNSEKIEKRSSNGSAHEHPGWA